MVVDAVVKTLLSDREGWSLYVQEAHLLSRLANVVGTDVVLDALLLLSVKERRRLVKHLDFLSEEPDDVLVALLEADRDERVWEEAGTLYLVPGEVVWGPSSEYLIRRKDRLIKWSRSHPSKQLREWAMQLIPSFTAWIERERLREAEGG